MPTSRAPGVSCHWWRRGLPRVSPKPPRGCALASGDGHDPGRHGNAATIRGCARRGSKRPAAGSRARALVGAAAGVRRGATLKPRVGSSMKLDTAVRNYFRLTHQQSDAEDPMTRKLVVLIAASAALIAVDPSGGQARTNPGAVVAASQTSVKSHGGPKAKNLRGKRNPNDQGREH